MTTGKFLELSLKKVSVTRAMHSSDNVAYKVT
jgi:hypothetical protein